MLQLPLVGDGQRGLRILQSHNWGVAGASSGPLSSLPERPGSTSTARARREHV